MLDSDFFTRLREVLKGKNLSQKKLAEMVGIDRNTISRWKNPNKPPSEGSIARIAMALNLNPVWLATGKGAKKSPILDHNQPFGDAEENNKMEGLPFQRHKKLGAELYVISQQLDHLRAELGGAYPPAGHLGRANVSIVRAWEAVLETRDYLEENFYKEHPSKRDLNVYSPGANMAFDSQNIISVNSNYVSEDYYQIPLYDVQAAAGAGAYVDGEQVEDIMALRKNWIQNELHLDPAHLSLIFVQGDSMEPTMSSGDTVLIDQRENQSLSDGVWVLRVDGALLVKRIQKFPGGKITVISDNSQIYPPYDIVADNLPDDLKFIGRVVWVGKRM